DVVTVNPSPLVAGGAAATVTVQGSGFLPTSKATLSDSSTACVECISGSLNGNTFTFSIPAAQLTVARTLFGIVTNPAPGGGSASFSVNVLNVKPTVMGVAPGTVDAGTNSLTIQVTGANFVSGSQVTVGGTPVATTFNSTAQLTAMIGSGFLAHAGS